MGCTLNWLQCDSTLVVFDQQTFQHHLSTQQLGLPLYHYEVLDSTSTQLWQLLQEGAQPGTTVIAAEQQAGRGQWGRMWDSARGGLYLSVAIAPQIPANQAAQITVASIWGIARLFREHHIPIWLKWPNDLLVCGQKLGGILTETSSQKGHIQTAVIGIGINWQNQVPQQAINLQTILQQSAAPAIDSLEQLAAVTLKGLEQGYLYWQTHGIHALLPDYLSLVKIYPANCDRAQEDLVKRLGL